MFSEIKNKNPIKFKKVRFNCDDPICEEMTKMTQWNHISKTNFSVFLGRPESGKTSLMTSIITNKNLYRNKFDNILLIMPSQSRSSLQDELLVDESKIFADLDDETIDNILEKIQEYSAQGENTLLILDDVASSLKSSSYIQQKLAYIVYNMRHLKTSIFLLVQSFLTIPRNLRKNITNLIVFKLSKLEMSSIGQEILELNNSEINQLMKLYTEKYDYLCINVNTQEICKNQNKVIKNEW